MPSVESVLPYVQILVVVRYNVLGMSVVRLIISRKWAAWQLKVAEWVRKVVHDKAARRPHSAYLFNQFGVLW